MGHCDGDDATNTVASKVRLPSFQDNFNMSPGMAGVIFHSTQQHSNEIICSEMIWGLCPKSGSKNHPLPPGVSKHFSNLMFNARSETLYEKRTFRELALNGQTCLWCIDGFFEWKEPEKNVLSNQSGKQPYFVYRKGGDLPLVIPGLFTKVNTGRIDNATGREETLETFTLITTAACQPLKWLHHRQPCFIWDMNLANEWLCNPSEELMTQISKLSSRIQEIDNCLAWHPVKKEMAKLSYRGKDSMDAIKIEKVASVKSFFTTASRSSPTPMLKLSARVKQSQLQGSSPKRDLSSRLDTEADGVKGDLIAATPTSAKRIKSGKHDKFQQPKSNPKEKGIGAFFSPVSSKMSAMEKASSGTAKRTKTSNSSRIKSKSTTNVEKKGSIVHFFSNAKKKKER